MVHADSPPIVTAADPSSHYLFREFDVQFFAASDDRTDEYRLRHQVFVDEYRWLESAPDGDSLERDEFDDYSVSFLLRDAATKMPAACQRLILPEQLPIGMKTPAEHLAGDQVPAGRPRSTWAEVSRTTIAAAYRWGAGSGTTPAMRAIKYASIALATAFGRDLLFSVSDPRTARLVRRMGVLCHRLGDLVQYHGVRALYRMDMAEIRASVPSRDDGELQALFQQARAAARRSHTSQT